jgi:hypothetical protein
VTLRPLVIQTRRSKLAWSLTEGCFEGVIELPDAPEAGRMSQR